MSLHFVLLLCVALAGAISLPHHEVTALIEPTHTSPRGVIVPIGDSLVSFGSCKNACPTKPRQIELAVYGPSSFRISISYNDNIGRIVTPMVADDDETTPYDTFQIGDWFGVSASFGEVLTFSP